jgi:hypothetical protein
MESRALIVNVLGALESVLPDKIGWRNQFQGINSWAPQTFTNSGSEKKENGVAARRESYRYLSLPMRGACRERRPTCKVFNVQT